MNIQGLGESWRDGKACLSRHARLGCAIHRKRPGRHRTIWGRAMMTPFQYPAQQVDPSFPPGPSSGHTRNLTIIADPPSGFELGGKCKAYGARCTVQ